MASDLSYREHEPIDALRGYVHCLWELQGLCSEASPQLIVPDGCMSLVLNFGEPVEQVMTSGEVLGRPKTLIIGEVRRPIAIQSCGRVELLGVRFRPGSIRSFIDASVAAVVDAVTDETPLGGSLSRRLSRTVHAAERADRKRLLQNALVEQVRTVEVAHGVVASAVRELTSNDGLVKIDALAAMFGVSRRQLERKFIEEVGVRPKTLANVLRFRRVLAAIGTSSVGWAEVAADCGYYDQSHLIRDFKKFTGRTPSVFGEQRSLTTLRIEATNPRAGLRHPSQLSNTRVE